ncbi:MAG TPA: cell division protein FtsA [Terriglobales bacterium]|jgi:cell division protein FtsA|nr:cell division protein FtsA [Terriglobales bacterium]
MARFEQNFLTAIDIGSAKTCALVAELTENGPRYCGHGISDARGSRKGVIVDLEKAVASVQRAVEQAEQMVGAPVERALVGVAGPHVRGVSSRGGISLGSRVREIGREEIRQAVDRARAFNMPEDRQTLHLLPQQFILDAQDGIRDPEGMVGTRLEAQVHVVTASATAAQTVVTALNRAGIHVDDTIYEPLASADAILRPDERELGVCLADIGAGSTDLIVYYEGAVVHSGVVPIGGDHFTNDVAVGLRTPLADAEKIKRSFGCAVVTRIPETNEIEVPAVGERPSRLMPQRFLCEVLQARAQELFEHVRENLRHAGVLELCGAGVVLTGGGARLNAIAETAEQVLRRPIRLPLPAPVDKMPAELAAPEFAAVIGMIFYGNRMRLARSAQEQRFTARLRALFAKKAGWQGTNAVTSDHR